MPKFSYIEGVIKLSDNTVLISGINTHQQGNKFTYSVQLIKYNLENGLTSLVLGSYTDIRYQDKPTVSLTQLANNKAFFIISSTAWNEEQGEIQEPTIIGIYSLGNTHAQFINSKVLKNIKGELKAISFGKSEVFIAGPEKYFYIFNYQTNKLYRVGPSHYSGHQTVTYLSKDKLLLTGGYVNSPIWSVDQIALSEVCNERPYGAEIFDYKSNKFSITGNLIIPRKWHKALPVSAGKVLIMGGSDETDCGFEHSTKRVEIFEYIDKKGLIQ